MSTLEREVALADAERGALRDLILVLADSKRLLGMRYAEWILGAPELEAGIACASMAQDEWGHARLLYALLRDFGEDVDALEHGREAAQYANLELLDRAPEGWPELVVLNALADTALSVQLEALRDTTYTPLRQRVQKMLDEERFHAAHGSAWFRRLASASGGTKAALAAAVESAAPTLLRWFGDDSPRAHALQEASVVAAAGSDLRVRFLERVAALLALLPLGDSIRSVEPDFGGFDEATRRAVGGGPDAETLARVRGDRNRAFLMD